MGPIKAKLHLTLSVFTSQHKECQKLKTFSYFNIEQTYHNYLIRVTIMFQ